MLGIICRWKLLDSVELKHNSVSFFDIEKPETAVSRWSRASAKAAKVRIGFCCSFNITGILFGSELEVLPI